MHELNLIGSISDVVSALHNRLVDLLYPDGVTRSTALGPMLDAMCEYLAVDAPGQDLNICYQRLASSYLDTTPLLWYVKQKLQIPV